MLKPSTRNVWTPNRTPRKMTSVRSAVSRMSRSAALMAENIALAQALPGQNTMTGQIDATRYRSRLQEIHLQLEQDIETHRQRGVALSGGPDEPGSGQHWERSDYGDHQADDATELFERGKEAGLKQSLEAHLSQVARALQRIDAGTYGQCETCDRPIPAERLNALPEATMCIDCKSREEERTAGAG